MTPRCKYVHNLPCEQVSERITELEDENAKLREQVTQLRDDWESERDYADQMEAKEQRAVAENAKLRELARKQDALTKAVHAYWAGGEGTLDDFNVMMGANAQVLSLMRELGIEVDE